MQQAKGRHGGGMKRNNVGEGSNQLKRDSLVVLTGESFRPLVLANIVIRDDDILVGFNQNGKGGFNVRGGGGGVEVILAE